MTKEERKEYMKLYNSDPKNKEKRKKWDKENSNKIKQYNKIHWRKKYGEFVYKGEEHRKLYMREYMREYNKKYPHIQRSKRLLNDVLRRFNQTKTNSTSKLLGYTALELKNYLEKQGMNWTTHQIDHKIPVSCFLKETPMNIINDLRNLQPLTKKDNLNKSDKYCTLVDKEYLDLVKKYLI